MRVIAFFPFAIAYLSLLPLVARAQMADGPQFYGTLLGAIGVGTVGGTLALTRLTIGADSLAGNYDGRQKTCIGGEAPETTWRPVNCGRDSWSVSRLDAK